MEIHEFQKKSTRTMRRDMTESDLIDNMIYGMIGETGEVVDILKKHKYQDHDLNYDLLIEELGDVMFYVSNFCTLNNIDMSELSYNNMNYNNMNMSQSNILFKLIKSIGDLSDKIYMEDDLIYKRLAYTIDINNIMIRIISLCKLHNLDFGKILDGNYYKLLKRFPDGFDADKSINR